MSKPVGYLFHQLLITLNINQMLRVFITVILYLISFFTQGQENLHFDQKEGEIQKFSIEAKVKQINDDNRRDSKFEVMDKDLTFEIKL